MSEQWLSIVDYARTFSVSDMTIRRRIKTGRLEAVLREGKYYIPVGSDRAGKPLRLNIRKESESFATAEADSGNFERDLARATFEGVTSQIPLSSQREPPQVRSQPVQVTGHVLRSRISPSFNQPNHRGTAFSDSERVREEAHVPQTQAPHGHYESGLIPGHIRLGIEESATSLVESKALLDFCESVLRRFSRLEARLEEGFKTKMTLLESHMTAKDQENNKLRQQIEDLQLLIKILEKGPGSGRE